MYVREAHTKIICYILFRRLTLVYATDQRAMSQAINQIVYMRSRVNKRLKIFLPQS